MVDAILLSCIDARRATTAVTHFLQIEFTNIHQPPFSSRTAGIEDIDSRKLLPTAGDTYDDDTDRMLDLYVDSLPGILNTPPIDNMSTSQDYVGSIYRQGGHSDIDARRQKEAQIMVSLLLHGLFISTQPAVAYLLVVR